MSIKVPAWIAYEVTSRAVMRCEYCRAPQMVIGQTFHIDHIVPKAERGKTSAENLCLACAHCNIAKSSCVKAIDPLTKKKVLLFNPRKDLWQEHFRWSKDKRILLGKTLKGRATVVALDMNAEILQEARGFWCDLKMFP